MSELEQAIEKIVRKVLAERDVKPVGASGRVDPAHGRDASARGPRRAREVAGVRCGFD
jgi:hypothetical protein